MAKKTAQTTDDEDRPKKRTNHHVMAWVLLAMVVTGLGGFGLTNFGGQQTAIATVGDQTVDVKDYARALRQEMQAFQAQIGQPVTWEMAKQFGLDARVRERLVTMAALDNESDRIGISVGDDRVAKEVMDIKAFKGVNGQFDREAYRTTLDRNGFTEADFESQIRSDIARSVLQGAVTTGFVAPEQMLATIASWAAERRGFSLLTVTESDLSAPLPAPTDADLKAFYDAHPDQFTAPEAKRITYAALLPEMLKDTVQLDEQALKDAYQQRISEFVQPERRLVERLVFPDQAAADAAKARLDAGTVTFEDLVKERGLTLPDIDMGEESKASLGAAGEAVFALTAPGIVGPLPSDLGPALYRMNGILQAQEIPYEEARATLASEQSTDAAAREIADKTEKIDDLLAGGATLEDLQKEAGMKLGTVDYVTGVTGEDPLEGYEAFRKAADKVTEDDMPEIIQLEDGGIVALQLDSTVPPALKPFDSVKTEVEDAWRTDALHKALLARADEIVAAVKGGASLGAFGIVDVTMSTTRDGYLEKAPETTMATAFKMAEGDLQAVSDKDVVAVLKLETIQPAAADGPEAQRVRAQLSGQIGQVLSQDAFALFSNALIAQTGVTLDEAAINAVNAQMN